MKTFVTFCLLIVSLATYSQSNYRLKGKVYDKATGDEVIGAVVLVTDTTGTETSTLSDVGGMFAINLKHQGPFRIRVSFIGYKQIDIEGVMLTAVKTKELEISLEEESVQLDAVCITVEKKPLAKQCVSVCYSTVAGVSGRRRRAGKDKSQAYGYSYQPPAGLPVNTESYSKIRDNKFQSVQSDPLSTFSIDVDNASYSNVRRMINHGEKPDPDAGRIEEMINYFPYDYPMPEDGSPFSITTEYGACPWDEDHHLLRVGIQATRKLEKDNMNSNLVFLVDVSGSMNDPDKLPLVVRSLQLLTDQLKNNDRVAIVVYAGAAGVVLPSTPARKKEQIMDALNQLSAGGSTAGGEGIEMAYEIASQNFIKNGNNRVILATDGDFNVGVSSTDELTKLIEKKRDKGIYLTICGYGMGNYKDDRMEAISNAGNGNYFYIDNFNEARKVFSTDVLANLYTVAKDVKIQVEFNPANVQSYRLIGYVNRLLEDEDFNDDTKDAGEVGAGHRVTALYEIVPAGSKSKAGKNLVDSLKYQRTSDVSVFGNEIATLKLRYKKPDENESRLLVHPVSSDPAVASQDYTFSVAVAAFGMLLRDSKDKGKLTYDDVLRMAKEGKGKDDEGYRAEFISMVKMAEKF
ncbi:MAG: von Willebrand factor type A domain-containing protein [Flavobacteriales bacterium]|nr:von Willebrand factor type A domain-containing protein [Flavobacteriales bacterium]